MTTIHLNEYIGETFEAKIFSCTYTIQITGVLYDPDLYANPVYIGKMEVLFKNIKAEDIKWNWDIIEFHKQVENGFFVKK